MAKQKFLLEDVAQAAGVSKSTVDRVLNGRPGVRASTLERVNAALERLGYAPNALARRIAPTAARVDILLPRNENLFFDDLVARLREEEARHDLDMRMVQMEGFDAPSLAAALHGISEETRAVIAVALDAPEVRDAVDRLEARGTRVVTLVSDVPQSRRSAYIGFDNFAAGRTAGALMALLVPPGAGSVAVLVGHLGLRDHLDRRSGFEQVIAERRPDVRMLQAGPCRDLPELAQELVAQLLAETPDLAGLYVAGAGNRGVVAALTKAAPPGLAVVGHELTATTRAALLAGHYQAVIVQDTRELARRALDMALSPRAGDDPMDSRPLAIQIVVKENLPPAEF